MPTCPVTGRKQLFSIGIESRTTAAASIASLGPIDAFCATRHSAAATSVARASAVVARSYASLTSTSPITIGK